MTRLKSTRVLVALVLLASLHACKTEQSTSSVRDESGTTTEDECSAGVTNTDVAGTSDQAVGSEGTLASDSSLGSESGLGSDAAVASGSDLGSDTSLGSEQGLGSDTAVASESSLGSDATVASNDSDLNEGLALQGGYPCDRFGNNIGAGRPQNLGYPPPQQSTGPAQPANAIGGSREEFMTNASLERAPDLARRIAQSTYPQLVPNSQAELMAQRISTEGGMRVFLRSAAEQGLYFRSETDIINWLAEGPGNQVSTPQIGAQRPTPVQQVQQFNDIVGAFEGFTPNAVPRDHIP